MSNKSGTSSQVISLPKGGGALQGIGEKFSPDLHTGTGNFTVPIALPSGRSGFQPQLQLVYSTGNGNSAFGLGWGLSVPGVMRKTSKGIPAYDDMQDTFILSGAEDLVPVEQQLGVSLYRPRTEGLFARIEHHRDANNDFWKVWSKDGLVSFYGTPRPTDTNTNWQDSGVVADPTKREKIFAWQLTQTVDLFGNRIEYEYDRDRGEDGPHQWDQLYLKQVRYADYTDQGETKFLISVTFEYENRTDAFSEYRAGFEIRTRRRCKQIVVKTHAQTESLIRTYHLVYTNDRHNSVSLLSQVDVVGHDGDRFEALPPLKFSYTKFEPEGRKFFPIQGKDLPGRSLANPELELADLFGNGLPDILEMNGTVRYWRNLGNGKFDLPREMRDAPAGLQLAAPGVQMLDADGDGRIDLLVSTDTLSGYFPLRFGGLWDRRSFQRYRVAPSFNLEDPEVKLVDLDGDGVTDAIRSGSRLECYFNDPHQGWNEVRLVERRALEEFPNVNFSDPRVKFADMTGDGLQDIVLVYDGKIEYWPNLGYGNWGKRVSMKNNPRFPYGYNPQRILLGDVDGDGLADLVYVDNTKVTLWINQSGNGWSAPIEIKGTPSVSDIDAVRLVDMLGTGISGILWSTDINGLSRSNLFFLDFTGGVKPYLLSEMDNRMGSVTRVAYAPSTRFYLEDEKRPQTRWKTPLPFPVQVVAQVEAIDEISKGKLTTQYHYHHGYWDGAEREFRGFGRVEQRDTEIFEDYNTSGLHAKRSFAGVDSKMFSPPLETRTWFHQGPIGDEFGEWEEADYSAEFWQGDSQQLTRPQAMVNALKTLPRRAYRDALRALRSSVLRTELYALDGTERQNRPYTVTESLYGVREEAPPSQTNEERLRIFFPQMLAGRTTQWERGDEPMTSFTFMGNYDRYGQLLSQISVAVPRGRNVRLAVASLAPGESVEDYLDKHQPYLVTQTRTTYAHRDDAQCYIVNRVTSTTVDEIPNNGRSSATDGSPSLFQLVETINNGSARRELISQSFNFYDGLEFEGLPFGQIDNYGALVRTETVVLTEEILREAYKSGDTVSSSAEVPPYLVLNETPAWTEEYPQEFRELLPTLAGYNFRGDSSAPEDGRGYFVTTERRRYDFHTNPNRQGRGLVVAMRDPLNRETTIAYDSFALLPTQVTDPVGLVMSADYDYRTFQPREVTDPNGNRTAYAFTPLGLLERTAIAGKVSESVGDTLEVPGMRLVYNFLAYDRDEQPISVRTIRRVHHASDSDVTLPERDETIETIEYSDGFGRLLQTRSQAEDIIFGDSVFGSAVLPANQSDPPGDATGQGVPDDAAPRVAVSGWQVYDNKGRVVEKYEPFFSTGWDYVAPLESQFGQKATMFYDPRGQVIRTINPDGSQQRVIYGIPANLDDPEQFTPTPWEGYTYDANDNASRTHAETARRYQHHWNTPSSLVVDALGRTVLTVERNRRQLPDGSWSAIEEYRTRSTYDIRGNLLTVTDALGRVAFRHTYDLANRPLRIESIDAGLRRTVLDALGNAVEGRDSKGAIALHAYDRLNRPIRLWARDDGTAPVTLRERLEYGDGGDPNQLPSERDVNRLANRLGKLFNHYDEAGLLTAEFYDFKGNLLEKLRRVISDKTILAVFEPPPPDWQVQAFRVDWQPPAGTTLEAHLNGLLDAIAYQTSITYDGLNRVKRMRYPQDVEDKRKELQPHYNRAGGLERVTLDGKIYVERIAYNAKGQRSLIAYGNGIMTRHAYAPETFRLVRLRTERYEKVDSFTYRPTGVPLQEFAYEYDLVGNILSIQDRTPESGILNNPEAMQAADPELAQLLAAGNALIRRFEYDPIYRLLSATGRECDIPPSPPPWVDQPRCVDLTRTRGYTERYQYDWVGNLELLQHQVNGSAANRVFALAENSDRLATVTLGQTVYNYTYDANGNLIQENGSRHFEWDYGDRMRIYRTQAGTAEPSVHAHYLYDASGQRVKKLVRKQGGQVEVTAYIDGIFEHHVQGDTENNTLHVMDNQSRIALVRVGQPFADDSTPAVKYHLGDHLGSSNLAIDDAGSWVNREEHTPYGETSFGSFAKKRYRFTGKERDEESGLYYHGARYYVPWLARWAGCDPLGMVDGINLYSYVKNSPLCLVDTHGTQHEQPDVNKVQQGASSQGSAASSSSPAVEVGKNAPNVIDVGETTIYAAPEVANKEQSQTRNDTVGEPGFWGSLIPIYGSGREAINHFQQGNHYRGLFWSALAVTDFALLKSLFVGVTKLATKAGGTLIAKEGAELVVREGAANIATHASTETTAVAAKEAAMSSTTGWEKLSRFPNIQMMQHEGWFIKRVNPEAGRFNTLWGEASLKAQYRGLQKLGNLATPHFMENGMIFTQSVGQTMTTGRGIISKNFWNSYFKGSYRMGTLLNDIRPRNMGINGIIFDPAWDPLTRGIAVHGTTYTTRLEIELGYHKLNLRF
jgi:RHS repeat-associated protein